MFDFITPDALTALFQVILIDLVLAGDNAIVIGLAAAGLPKEQRSRAILIGIGAATLLRIVFAGLTTQLLQIVGLLLAGGLLLLWVCWKMWRELRAQAHHSVDDIEALANDESAPRKTLAQATWQIIIADVSMSLDNVLAVAGAAREHPWVLVFGLLLSIAMMGVAASFIARLLQRHRWIAYVGLAVILYVAGDMIYRGFMEVQPQILSWIGDSLES
ncbi:Integral membrane protein, YjbE family OS=Afipia felis OX=1035 GN=ygdQ PE=3 SV=1 [Afipia felis]